MNKTVLYIHGRGGNAAEAEHYKSLFPDDTVIGMDYRATTPWAAETEFPRLFAALCGDASAVTVIANSIGAYFAMSSLGKKPLESAFLISPVVDMEKLITDMMSAAKVTESQLREAGSIVTPSGETLLWEYLIYARKQQIDWNIPTHILYGEKDQLTPEMTVSAFAKRIGATLTVMPGGEHWFHTKEQMRFLDGWLQALK